MNDTPANMGWIMPSIRVLPTAEKRAIWCSSKLATVQPLISNARVCNGFSGEAEGAAECSAAAGYGIPQQTEGAQQAERAGKMNADAWKKRLLLHLPYGVIGLAAAKLSEAWRLSAGTDFSAKFLHLRDGAAMAFRNGMSGFVPLDLLIGFLCGCALCLLVHAKRRNAKKYRHGEEYGAARWSA